MLSFWQQKRKYLFPVLCLKSVVSFRQDKRGPEKNENVNKIVKLCVERSVEVGGGTTVF